MLWKPQNNKLKAQLQIAEPQLELKQKFKKV